MGTAMPWPVISRSLAMICSTLCFFTGTRGLLRSYRMWREPQTKWTDLEGAGHYESSPAGWLARRIRFWPTRRWSNSRISDDGYQACACIAATEDDLPAANPASYPRACTLARAVVRAAVLA